MALFKFILALDKAFNMKSVKFFLKSFVAILLLMIFLCAVITLIFQTEQGQQWLLQHVIRYVEKETDAQVEIEKIELISLTTLRIHHLGFRKERGVALTIQQIDLSCHSPELFLEGKIVCSAITAKGVKIDGTKVKDTSSSEIDWEHLLPIYAKVENLVIEDLRLTPRLIGSLVDQPDLAEFLTTNAFHLKGYLSYNPLKVSISAHLLLRASESPIQLAIDVQNQQLSFSLHCKQTPLNGQWCPNLLANTQGSIAWHAAASMETWKSLFTNSNDLIGEVEGSFKGSLSMQEEEALLSAINDTDIEIKGKYRLLSKECIQIYESKIENAYLALESEFALTKDLYVDAGRFAGEIKQLDRLQKLIPIELQGSAEFSGQLAGSLTSPTVNLQLKSPSLQIHGYHLQDAIAAVQGKVNQEGFQGDLQLTSALFQSKEYRFTNLQTALKGSFDSQAFQGDLSIKSLAFYRQGEAFEDLDAIFNGIIQKEFAKGEMDLVTTYGQVPYHLRALFNWQKDQWLQLPAMHLEGLESTLSGHLNIYLPNLLTEGQLDYQVQDLQAIASLLLPVSIQGQTHGHLYFRPLESGKQEIALESIGKHMHLEDWKAEEVFISAHVADDWSNLFKECQISSEIELGQFQYSKGYADHIHIKSNQIIHAEKKSFSQISADIQGQFVRWEEREADHLTFKLSGHWNLVENQIEATLSHLDGQVESYPLILMDSVGLTYRPGFAQVRSLHFALGDSEFKSDLTIQQNQIEAHFEGHQIPSTLLRFISSEVPITGEINLIADLKGPLEHPTGQAQLFLHRMQVTGENFASQPLVEGEMHLGIHEEGITVHSSFYGIGKTPITAQGTLPFHLSFSPIRLYSDEKIPLYLVVAAEGELDPYLLLFYKEMTNLSGQAKIALTIQGSLKAPQIHGEIEVYNGIYESFSTGAIYKNIQAHLEGDGTRLVLKNFSAQDHKQGSITANGTVILNASAGFPFEFQIQPTQIFIVDSDYAVISASGSLLLVGNRQQSKLQGTLKADQALIKMEEALPTQIKSVEVKYVNFPEGEQPPRNKVQENQWPLQLDIKLDFPNHVLIEGKNLKSDWKGSIHMTGTSISPLLNGEWRVSNGQYNFNGKIFNLTQGSIHFAGSASKKTTLYVVASKEIERIRAEIIVKGPTNKLAISFRSNPPLSQREVLSYILFNRGISDITPDQGDVLSQSFMEFNSESGQTHTDFLSRLRNNMGIDRLDLTSSNNENQDLALQVGRYISDGVFVSYNKSINAGYDRVAIEANIRKNLKAQAEVGIGDTAQGKLLLKWKKDY